MVIPPAILGVDQSPNLMKGLMIIPIYKEFRASKRSICGSYHISEKSLLGIPSSLDGLFMFKNHGKSHRTKWMMTRGTRISGHPLYCLNLHLGTAGSLGSLGQCGCSFFPPSCWWDTKVRCYDNQPQVSGWWYTYPSEKYESQLGSLFPIYGKS